MEQITGPVAQHGEGPVWSPAWGGLRWVDLVGGDVLSLNGDGSVSRHHVSTVVAALRPRTNGGAVLAIERGFALESPDGSIVELPDVWSDPRVRMNEGGCDPAGRFYCGSMGYDHRPGAGSLYRLDIDCSTRVVLEAVTVSNGLDFDPAGQFAYYVDTVTHRIDVLEIDEGGSATRRPFVRLADQECPDGLTVDHEGGVWVALWGSGTIRRYSPTGQLDAVVDLPTKNVTACAFGGPGLTELYVTTSREGVDTSVDGVAGSLFRVDVGVNGRPVLEFAG